MKKNNKNKNIKILITSLLCGLVFTCANVSAMQNKNNQNQQISQKSNNNLTNISNDNDYKKLTPKNQENKNLNTISNLTNVDTDYETKKTDNDNEKIKKKKEIIKNFNFICYLTQQYINFRLDFALQSFKFVDYLREIGTSFLDEDELKKFDEKIQDLHKNIENKIISQLDDDCKRVKIYIDAKDFDSALSKVRTITEKKNLYEQYLSEENSSELDYKIKKLKELF